VGLLRRNHFDKIIKSNIREPEVGESMLLKLFVIFILALFSGCGLLSDDSGGISLRFPDEFVPFLDVQHMKELNKTSKKAFIESPVIGKIRYNLSFNSGKESYGAISSEIDFDYSPVFITKDGVTARTSEVSSKNTITAKTLESENKHLTKSNTTYPSIHFQADLNAKNKRISVHYQIDIKEKPVFNVESSDINIFVNDEKKDYFFQLNGKTATRYDPEKNPVEEIKLLEEESQNNIIDIDFTFDFQKYIKTDFTHTLDYLEAEFFKEEGLTLEDRAEVIPVLVWGLTIESLLHPESLTLILFSKKKKEIIKFFYIVNSGLYNTYGIYIGRNLVSLPLQILDLPKEYYKLMVSATVIERLKRGYHLPHVLYPKMQVNSDFK